MFIIEEQELKISLQRWNRDTPFFAPVQERWVSGYQKFAQGEWQPEHFTVPAIRDALPLKSLFFPPLQKVAEYPSRNRQIAEVEGMVILFPKSCDLQALKILDKVFAEGDYPDPYYMQARRKHIIVATDCTLAGEHCFCTLMNSQPFPKDNFDLNITPLDGVYLIETGSATGKQILEKYFQHLQPALPKHLKQRDRLRERITRSVQEHNQSFKYYQTHQQAIEKHLDSDIWEYLSRTCVECGICTQICPTCHCFLLYDQPAGKRYERIKVWDSCFFAGYARMAGGLTPRLRLADRFKNRFYHKFDSFVTNFGTEACTGCGRCVEGCMGNIDLREVLMELEKRVVLKENIDLN